MELVNIKFYKSVGLFTAAICIVSAFVYGYIAPEVYTPSFPVMFIYFFLFSIVGFKVYSKAMKTAPAKAANYYIMVRMAKMLITLLGAFIYCFINRSEVLVFLITLAVLYLLYLVFETWFYYAVNLTGNKKTKNDETNK